jgi:hypothetical protein
MRDPASLERTLSLLPLCSPNETSRPFRACSSLSGSALRPTYSIVDPPSISDIYGTYGDSTQYTEFCRPRRSDSIGIYDPSYTTGASGTTYRAIRVSLNSSSSSRRRLSSHCWQSSRRPSSHRVYHRNPVRDEDYDLLVRWNMRRLCWR